VREYAQNYIGSRGDALRNVRNARQRCSAPRGGREKGRVIAEDGVDITRIKAAITAQGYTVGNIQSQPYEKHGLFSRKR